MRRLPAILLALALLGCDAARPPMAMSVPPPSPIMMAPTSQGLAGSAVVARAAPAATPAPERFANERPNRLVPVAAQPVATISLASDTASYGIARRLIREGRLPPPEAIRPEEFLNAFTWNYPVASDPAQPFQPFVSVHPAPWDANRRLLHIGLRTRDVAAAERPPLNLTFLIDNSGSMAPPDRLALVTGGIRMLLPQLTARDRVSIVGYAGFTRVVLDSARGDQRPAIETALDQLSAAGGTAGASGIDAAYRLASRNFAPRAVNRVILATDGDFNLGISDPRALQALIKSQRDRGIYLTAIGVGLDNLTDRTMHALARAGNGTYAYAADAADTHRILVEDFGANILPVANDVKLEVEFNPAEVAEYRLIGFETRALRREDFNDDQVDAGEIGSGRAVTAIFEMTLAGQGTSRRVDPLRYGRDGAPPAGGEIAFLRVRYKPPGQSESRLLQRAVTQADASTSFAAAPLDARFGAAVAGFAQVLRRADGMGWPLPGIAAAAQAARGDDPDGRRAEFVALVRLAASLPTAR